MKASLTTIALVLSAGVSVAGDDTEARLEEARERLEEAAREIAELTSNIGVDALALVERVMVDADRAMLGVNIADASEQSEKGVAVSGVSPGGPADEAGLRAGDVLLSLDGISLSGDDDSPLDKLMDLMDEVEAGAAVTVEYQRDGRTEIASIVTERFAEAFAFGLPEDFDFKFDFNFPEDLGGRFRWKNFHSRWGKMELVALTPKLGAYFGTDEGLLVVRAPDDSSLGLEEGDVIIAIAGRVPDDPAHAMRILRSYEDGELLSMEVVREQRRQTVEAILTDDDAELHESNFRHGPRDDHRVIVIDSITT